MTTSALAAPGQDGPVAGRAVQSSPVEMVQGCLPREQAGGSPVAQLLALRLSPLLLLLLLLL